MTHPTPPREPLRKHSGADLSVTEFGLDEVLDPGHGLHHELDRLLLSCSKRQVHKCARQQEPRDYARLRKIFPCFFSVFWLWKIWWLVGTTTMEFCETRAVSSVWDERK